MIRDVASCYQHRAEQIKDGHISDFPPMAVTVEFYTNRAPAVFVMGTGNEPCRKECQSAIFQTIGALADAAANCNALDAH